MRVRGYGVLNNRKAPRIMRVEQREFIRRCLAITKGVINRVASESRFPAVRQVTGCHSGANQQSAASTWSACRRGRRRWCGSPPSGAAVSDL